MSTSNLRTLASRVPKVSLKGLAYLASANFLSRAIILLKHYVLTSFHSEMIVLYGATLDTRLLLFFQGIYMLPMFLLGVLVFYGIERESFNLVLYPTLMLVFLILLRYGSEAALLANDWEQHKIDQTPELVFTMIQDIIFIGLLLMYVYVCLAFTPIKPTPLELLESGNAAFQSAATSVNVQSVEPNIEQLAPVLIQHQPEPLQQTSQQSQIRVLDSDTQGFNYDARRNIDQKAKDIVGESKPLLLDAIDSQRQQSTVSSKGKGSKSWFGWGGRGGGSVIETDIDATAPVAIGTTAVSQQTTNEIPVVETMPSQGIPEVEPPQIQNISLVEPVPIQSVPLVEPTPIEEAPPVTASLPKVIEEVPVVTPEPPPPVKLNKSRIAAARKKLADTQKEPEKPPEPELDFWASLNGEPGQEETSKPESFKTTSV